MASRSGWWRWGTFAFGVVNVAGAVYHIATGEMFPVMVHAALAAVSFVAWQAMFRRRSEPDTIEAAAAPEIESHIDNLQRAVDSIALEVERIGEGQRFAQKILEDRREEDPGPRE